MTQALPAWNRATESERSWVLSVMSQLVRDHVNAGEIRLATIFVRLGLIAAEWDMSHAADLEALAAQLEDLDGDAP